MASSKTVPSLAARILTPENTAQLSAEFVNLVQERIDGSPGLKGIALRTSVSMLTATRPDILTHGMTRLLPEFIAALQPLYDDYRRSGGNGAASFGAFLIARRESATAAMMRVADARAAGSKHALYQRFYKSMRGTIELEAERFIPILAARIDETLQSDTATV
ncbi:MAG: hypothetical protein EPN72_12155 [Nevskiaceae bacterium]|nr:MAG: hypothetical protein EPN63_00820 [Nevskiaceae bacterium]TBR71934.1 MAG: hypothetical protein EPN72_12155 [Nevskiaceae bacterium]